jgi:hypothetical protein
VCLLLLKSLLLPASLLLLTATHNGGFPAAAGVLLFRAHKIIEECLKGLSYEIDFENVDKNGQILALIRAASGF